MRRDRFRGFEFGITDVEINQAIGKQLSPATYFAGKATAVRVRLSALVSVNPATQRVRVIRDNATVTTMYPAESAGEKTSMMTFLCPTLAQCGGWQAGSYRFEAEIDGAAAEATATFQTIESHQDPGCATQSQCKRVACRYLTNMIAHGEPEGSSCAGVPHRQ